MVTALVDPRPSPAHATAPSDAGADVAMLASCLAAGTYQPAPDVSLDDWLVHGRSLARRWSHLLWLTADWARCGIDYFGPTAWSHLATVSGRDKETLRKMIAASRRFPVGRRRPGIPFSRHGAVIALPDDAADELLERAEREGWNQQDLTRQVRALRGRSTRLGSDRPQRRLPVRGTTATTAVPTTALVVPGVSGSKEAAPIRCESCRLGIGYALLGRAIVSNGPAAVQRIPSGQLTMNLECPACQSTTLVSLGALEIPTSAGLGC